MSSAAPTIGYNFIKDLTLFIRSRERHIEVLRDSLALLLTNLITIKSRKGQIDEFLKSSTTKMPTGEYKILKKNIEKIEQRTKDFIGKYKKFVKDIDLNSLIASLDDSAAVRLLDELERTKPSIMTKNIFKLARLDIDVLRLNGLATMVIERLKSDNLITDKESKDAHRRIGRDKKFPGIQKYVDEVVRLLDKRRIVTESQERLIKVGITGPVQIGKTTVLERLQQMFSNHDHVAKTTYSKDLAGEDQVVDMQRQIMGAFKMNVDEMTDNVDTNVKRISTFLDNKEYILLIDNVSSEINLAKLGILKEHNGKVVIASRSKKVVRKLAHHVVEIQKLSDDDARTLFFKIIQGKVDGMRKQMYAKEIIELCGGEPVMITLAAEYLKSDGQEEIIWVGYIKKLQSDVKGEGLRLTVISKAYTTMYEKLEDREKRCLLFEALFPSDQKLPKDYLIECWMAEKFIKTQSEGFWGSRSDGSTVLRNLIDVHLLTEFSDDKRFVMMPPLFRSLVLCPMPCNSPEVESKNIQHLSIKQEFCGELINPVICGSTVEEELNGHIWGTATMMSLIGCKSMLPTSPQCAKLRSLLMQRVKIEPESTQLSEDFFINMTTLQLLDLQRTELQNLPVSVVKLSSLRYLYLTECGALRNLPSDFGMLKQLELLDISKTGISSLPMEIEPLVNLRCLRATLSPKKYNPNSKGKEVVGSQSIIPPNIIKGLKKLEELSIDIEISCESWKNSVDDCIVDEIASLEHLNTLRYNFPNMESLIKFVASSKSMKNKATQSFRSFEIYVGSYELKHPYSTRELEERRLRLSKVEGSSEDLSAILKQTKIFELSGDPKVKCLSKLDLDGMEVCVIENCTKLKYVVNSNKLFQRDSRSDVLQYVKKLHLYNLPLLKCIWKGSILGERLKWLTDLTLHGCHTLTTILDLNLATSLPELKYLEVENCGNISLLVEVPQGSSGDKQFVSHGILNELQTLKVSDLPKLESICGSKLNWESLTTMFIQKCEKLTNLSTLKNAKSLKIHCDSSWSNAFMMHEENKWIASKLPNRDRHEGEGEASTSAGGRSFNPDNSTLCKTNDVSENLPWDAHAGENGANSMEEDPSTHDKPGKITYGNGFSSAKAKSLSWLSKRASSWLSKRPMTTRNRIATKSTPSPSGPEETPPDI